MTEAKHRVEPSKTSSRLGISVVGILAIIAGILVLVRPGGFVLVGTIAIAVYAIIAGLVYFFRAIFASYRSGWSRLAGVIVGIVYVAAGIIALMNLVPSAVALAAILVIFIGVVWVIEGITAIVAFVTKDVSGWSLFFGIVSIFAGLFLIFDVIWGMIALVIYIGVALIVLGIIQVARAFASSKQPQE